MDIIIPTIFLSLFGLFNLFGVNVSLFFRQLEYTIIGFAGFYFIKKIGYYFFRENSKFFYWLFLGILAITFIIGIEARGSKRWLDLYFFNFQASEFFKVFFILYMADFFSSKKILENDLVYFLKSFIYFFIPAFIIFKQPDLANAAVFAFVYLIMIIFSQDYKKHLGYLAGLALMFAPLGWLVLRGYQRARLMSFLNPHLDTKGISYNMIQAVITIGSGMFFGRGLGLGTQSKLFFLPENTTDFAYASLVEQFGFVGGFLVILFYAAIIYILAKKTIKYYYQRDRDGQRKFLYCLGLLSYLFFQISVNIGMNMGLLPVAGVALPFITYGGSSVLAVLLGFALLP